MKLNYPGDHVNFDEDHIYGPDRFGACYYAESAVYDEELDKTTITLKPILE